MTLIVCVDDRMGMSFNKRRQSRDSKVCCDMVSLAGGRLIGMDERSAKIFLGLEANIVTGEDALNCEYYFAEFDIPEKLKSQNDGIVIYRWNRHYPADKYFDLSLEGYSLAETTEFAGSSHEKITKEVYTHE